MWLLILCVRFRRRRRFVRSGDVMSLAQGRSSIGAYEFARQSMQMHTYRLHISTVRYLLFIRVGNTAHTLHPTGLIRACERRYFRKTFRSANDVSSWHVTHIRANKFWRSCSKSNKSHISKNPFSGWVSECVVNTRRYVRVRVHYDQSSSEEVTPVGGGGTNAGFMVKNRSAGRKSRCCLLVRNVRIYQHSDDLSMDFFSCLLINDSTNRFCTIIERRPACVISVCMCIEFHRR